MYLNRLIFCGLRASAGQQLEVGSRAVALTTRRVRRLDAAPLVSVLVSFVVVRAGSVTVVNGQVEHEADADDHRGTGVRRT